MPASLEMQAIVRAAKEKALASGSSFYVTGIPCKYGHYDGRYLGGGHCITCQSDRQKNSDVDRRRARVRESYARHRAKKLEQNRAYAKRNKGLFARFQREWRAKNPDRNKINRSKRRLSTCFAVTQRDIDRLRIRQGCVCAACAKPLAHGEHIDHIIPIARGGVTSIGNLQILCPECNMSKGSTLFYEWKIKKLQKRIGGGRV